MNFAMKHFPRSFWPSSAQNIIFNPPLNGQKIVDDCLNLFGITVLLIQDYAIAEVQHFFRYSFVLSAIPQSPAFEWPQDH